MYDENQTRAIRHLDGPALVIAGPGAGKTYTIVERIKHLVRQAHIPPENVLVITFTGAAASEMKARYRRCVSTSEYGVTFGTFHSIYYSILRDNRLNNSISLIDEKTKRYLVSKSAAMEGIKAGSIPEGYARLLGAFSSVKNTGRDFEEFAFAEISPQELERIFNRYEDSKRQLERIDFDDMLTLTYKLLQEREDILEKYRKRYRYILVDEAQDMNRIQFDVIRLIAAPADNIFLVGDDDQSIYAFRGADSDIMLSFNDYYPKGRIITLNKNFRSAAGVIEAAGNVISHNTHRYEKDYSAVSSGEAKIRYLGFADDQKEAECIATMVRQESLSDEKKSIGILFRNHRQSVLIRECFEAMDFDYFGRKKSSGIPEDYTAKVISDYLGLAVYGYRRDAILRIMNVPERFLPRTGIGDEIVKPAEWADYHRDDPYTRNGILKFFDDLNRIKKLPSYGAVLYVCRKIGYEKFAAENRIDGYRQTIETLQTLAEKYPDKKAFLEKLKADKKEGTDTVRDSNVYLYTFHASKGLEFDSVYIMDACEDITPSRFAKSIREIEEERRMFYVAMTRAKTGLIIVTAKKTGKQETYPSRFIKEMNDTTRQEERQKLP